MANYRFTSDIINDVLFRSGEPTDGSSDFEDEVLRLVNRAYRAVWTGGGEFVKSMNERWLWLKKDPPGVLTLLPAITAGDVFVTNNSTSITFSSAPADSAAGLFFRVDPDGTMFRIASHTGGAGAATLDSPYTGQTGTFAYQLMKLEYTLAADCLRPVAPMRVQSAENDEIDAIDLPALDRDYPLTSIAGGMPTKFALVTETKVRFNRYGGTVSDEFFRVEYDYLQKPADLTDSGSEEPLLPLEYRHVLADIALFYLWTSKNDERAELAASSARAGLIAMQADNRARTQQASRSYGAIYQRGRWERNNVRILMN